MNKQLSHFLTLIITVLLIGSTKNVYAQPPHPTLSFTVVSGHMINFNFNGLAELTDGVRNQPEHRSIIRISSPSDWKLSMIAADANMYGNNNPVNTIPVDNVGVVVEDTFNNATVNNANGVPLGLSISEQTLLKGDWGFNKTKEFVLKWEVGTRGSGTMNVTSLFDQKIKADSYFLEVNFILMAE